MCVKKLVVCISVRVCGAWLLGVWCVCVSLAASCLFVFVVHIRVFGMP